MRLNAETARSVQDQLETRFKLRAADSVAMLGVAVPK